MEILGQLSPNYDLNVNQSKKSGGGYEGHFALDLQPRPDLPAPDNYPILFSAEINPTQALTRRPLKSDEKDRIKSILTKKKLLYEGAIHSIEIGKGSAASNNDATIYILPWFRTQGEYSSNDVFLVGILKNGLIHIRGIIEGEIRGVFTVVGHKYPTVLISESCDGRCEFLYSIESPSNPLVGISVH